MPVLGPSGEKKGVLVPVFPKKPAGPPCAQPWLAAVGGWVGARWRLAVGCWQLAVGGQLKQGAKQKWGPPSAATVPPQQGSNPHLWSTMEYQPGGLSAMLWRQCDVTGTRTTSLLCFLLAPACSTFCWFITKLRWEHGLPAMGGPPPLLDSWSKVHHTAHGPWIPHYLHCHSPCRLHIRQRLQPQLVPCHHHHKDSLGHASRSVDSSPKADSVSEWLAGISKKLTLPAQQCRRGEPTRPPPPLVGGGSKAPPR